MKATEQAIELNHAACSCYLFMEGLLEKLPGEQVELVAKSNRLLLSSAMEMMEARNAESPNQIHSILDESQFDRVLLWARQRVEEARRAQEEGE